MNQALAKEFLNAGRFAVVGASTDRSKYGNKVLRWYQDRKMSVVPINPKADEIEGLPTARSLEELVDNKSTAVSVITPGPITLAVLQSAKRLNVPYLWLQPGADDASVKDFIKSNDMGDRVLYGGPCILRDGPALLSKL